MSDKGNNIESIGTERILTLFWRFALPGMGAMLAMAAQSIADGLIVGRFLGSSALAAVNIVLPAYTLVTTVALILGVGTQAQMSLHIGTGNYYKAKSAFKSGLTGLLFFVITGTVLINLHAEKIAYVLGANEELISMSVQYMYGVMPWVAGLCTFLFLASSETEVLKITLKGTYIVSFAFLFNGLNILVTSYYTAINKGGMSLLISSLRGLVFIVIGIYTLPLLFGVDGIWLTYPFADFLTLTIVGFLIYKKIYK